MTEITTDLIKELRERSGAGIVDCKKALIENNADMEAAIDWLRKKGLSAVAKKSSRVTAEGLVSVYIEGNNGVVLEVNSETDFVAKNEKFQNFVKKLSGISLKAENGNVEALKSATYEGNLSVNDELNSLIATIGENLTIRRFKQIKAEGKLFSYVHNTTSEGLGKIGVIVAFANEGTPENIGKQVAMHISATQPLALDKESLNPAEIEREREVQKAKALEEGKPADIVDKMVEGRLSKFYQEVCLTEQPFIMDTDKKISQLLKENNAKITDYAYFVLGSGIEKVQADFATEVDKIIKGE
ncbi:MAG: translation elongation factor Ts [Alphaproteobacteria bacterium]|jgi:elongation factor Ts|nr:translation elongation factor Ts [Alphaproteobacteria bacterium]